MLATVLTVGMFLTRVEAAHGPVSHAELRLDAPLTQSAVVTISERAGVKVSTQTPEAAMTRHQVDTYFAVFNEQLGSTESHRRRHGRPHKSKRDPDGD